MRGSPLSSMTRRAFSGVVFSLLPMPKSVCVSRLSSVMANAAGPWWGTGRCARPGTVQTSVPENGLTCLIVPSGSVVSGGTGAGFIGE